MTNTKNYSKIFILFPHYTNFNQPAAAFTYNEYSTVLLRFVAFISYACFDVHKEYLTGT